MHQNAQFVVVRHYFPIGRHAMTKKMMSFHFLVEYSKVKTCNDRLKMMCTRGKINANWLNIKINLQKLVDIRVDMKCQQVFRISRKKDSTEVKIFPKLLGVATFFEIPVGVIYRGVIYHTLT